MSQLEHEFHLLEDRLNNLLDSINNPASFTDEQNDLVDSVRKHLDKLKELWPGDYHTSDECDHDSCISDDSIGELQEEYLEENLPSAITDALEKDEFRLAVYKIFGVPPYELPRNVITFLSKFEF